MSHVRNIIFSDSTDSKIFSFFRKGKPLEITKKRLVVRRAYVVLPTEIKARRRPIISCLQRTTGPRGIGLSHQRTSLRAAKAISLSAPDLYSLCRSLTSRQSLGIRLQHYIDFRARTTYIRAQRVIIT